MIGAEVGELLYKPLADQLKYLTTRVGIAPPTPEQISRLSVARATRNVLVHNRGVANTQYLTLAGPAAQHKLGERVEVSEPYRREVWELLRQLVGDLSAAAPAKAAPDLPPPAPPG